MATMIKTVKNYANKPRNAGKYNKRIRIISETETEDDNGFPITTEQTVLEVKANIKTTKGMTLIANNSDFEKAYTNFTIRYPKLTEITREMYILYPLKFDKDNNFIGKKYSIEYINNVDEEYVELEIQGKLVKH